MSEVQEGNNCHLSEQGKATIADLVNVGKATNEKFPDLLTRQQLVMT